MDESGFSLVSPLKRTWAPRGETPVLRTCISHYSRLNVIGGLVISPQGRRIRLLTRSHRQNITGAHIIAFLRVLLRRVRGPIVLVWDNHPIHQRKLVARFIEAHPRLHVFTFPRYAPELNPAEGIWTQTSGHIAGTAPRHMGELECNIGNSLRRIRRSASRLWACIHMSDLPWER